MIPSVDSLAANSGTPLSTVRGAAAAASSSSLSAASGPSSSSSSSSHGCRRPNRGAFVVLEGIDRSGKTTQCKLLWQRLIQAGIAATCWRFPNRTTATGRIINEYLQQSQMQLDDHAIHLLFSANRWEVAQNLARTLYNGTTVICDRYAYSGVAFSSAKGGATITPTQTTTTTATATATPSQLHNDKENIISNDLVAPKNSNKDNVNINNNNNMQEEDEDGGGKEEKRSTDSSSSSLVTPTGGTLTTDKSFTPLLSLDWCQAPDRGLPAPDCVIFLQLSPEEAEQRGGYVGVFGCCCCCRSFDLWTFERLLLCV